MDSACFMPPVYGTDGRKSVSSPKLFSSNSKSEARGAVAPLSGFLSLSGRYLKGLDDTLLGKLIPTLRSTPSSFKYGNEIAVFTLDEPPGVASLDLSGLSRLTDCERLLLLNVRDNRLCLGEVRCTSGSRGGSPERVLRKEVSPNASPPRPTCIVWRKSPRGALIISAVRSARERRFDWEDVDTSCFRIGMMMFLNLWPQKTRITSVFCLWTIGQSFLKLRVSRTEVRMKTPSSMLDSSPL